MYTLALAILLWSSAPGLARAQSTLGSFTSHNLFANLYYDFHNDSRWTPYIGAGIGVGFAELDWGQVWARSLDPSDITTGAGLPNASEIRERLAGGLRADDRRHRVLESGRHVPTSVLRMEDVYAF